MKKFVLNFSKVNYICSKLIYFWELFCKVDCQVMLKNCIWQLKSANTLVLKIRETMLKKTCISNNYGCVFRKISSYSYLHNWWSPGPMNFNSRLNFEASSVWGTSSFAIVQSNNPRIMRFYVESLERKYVPT